MSSKELERFQQIDKSIIGVSKNIKVLSGLSWPSSTLTTFLQDWRGGNPKLPRVSYPPVDDLAENRAVLSNAERQLSGIDHPLARYLQRTAASYLTSCRLLEAAGTSDMLMPSRALYGAPGDPLSEGKVNNLDAANHFLESSDQYYRALHLHDADYCLSAQTMKTSLETRLTDVFPEGVVRVSIDKNLASKAAAGATRIRLRDETCFSEYDLEQLLQHEAFIHSLTALNGQEQINLRCMGLGAPRTTGSQEGLATFAEVITGAIDIDRMERIALRILAIDMALKGADFLDVFRFFLDRNQPEEESFRSAMRVFRGAPLTGGAAFTKDVVYLHGLMEVHTFFRWAMHHQRLDLCRYVMAGRMTIPDVIELAPLFSDGTLSAPKYLPPWLAKTNGLAGYLAFSVFANKVSIAGIDEEHRFDRVQDLEAID